MPLHNLAAGTEDTSRQFNGSENATIFAGPVAGVRGYVRTVNRPQASFVHRVVHMALRRHDTFYSNSKSTNRRCVRTGADDPRFPRSSEMQGGQSPSRATDGKICDDEDL